MHSKLKKKKKEKKGKMLIHIQNIHIKNNFNTTTKYYFKELKSN